LIILRIVKNIKSTDAQYVFQMMISTSILGRDGLEMDFTSTDVFYVMLVTIIIMGGFFFLVVRKLIVNNRILQDALSKRQSQATIIGRNTALGDIHQFIGEFAILSEYDELILLSTTSRQASLDVIGIIENRMDFIEIKKKGARITPSENKIRRIIEEKNIEYVVKDVEIPTGIKVEDRELPKLRQRNFENKPCI